ncbi:hypothetical protein ACFFMP_02775 [Pseudoroseomonas cervicalis]|uniref:hypothetical protein n=1 Tax=Teichococcus cervicalis TaxID=204525 RepID=UPI0035E48E2B
MPQRVTVRTGQHPGFSRIVFDWPELPGYTLVQQGDVVELVFGPAGTLAFEAASVRPPRNIASVEPLSGGLRLRLTPGSRARHFVLGRRVVVDLLDPPAPPTPPAQRRRPTAPSLATPRRVAGREPTGLPPAAALAPPCRRGAGPPAAGAAALAPTVPRPPAPPAEAPPRRRPSRPRLRPPRHRRRAPAGPSGRRRPCRAASRARGGGPPGAPGRRCGRWSDRRPAGHAAALPGAPVPPPRCRPARAGPVAPGPMAALPPPAPGRAPGQAAARR